MPEFRPIRVESAVQPLMMVGALATPLAIVSTAMLLLVGCDGSELSKLNPRIVVEPEALDFGDGNIDQDNILPLLVKNRGAGILEISDVLVEPQTGIFSAALAALEAPLMPNEERVLNVVFRPSTPKEVYNGALLLQSNDPLNETLRVPLTGVGGIREIEVFPEEIDFGLVNEGAAPRMTLEIRNLGGDPLIVSEVVWTSTSADMSLVEGTFLSGAVMPMTSTVVEVVYSPIDLGGDAATITIRSNDEDEPEVIVPVRGRANLAPRAIAFICDKVLDQFGCLPTERRKRISAGFGGSLALDGTDAFDPEGGEILEFKWEILEKPENSLLSRPFTDGATDGATGDFPVDRVGRYHVRLTVKDERGLQSIPNEDSDVWVQPKDLEVLLRWDLETDVDIHLVQPGGALGDYGSGRVGTSTGSDCSTFNRAPNWGDISVSTDDPGLDKDEVSGQGPERISIDDPETQGPYTVWAHYCDSRGVGINVFATVEVWVKGELIQIIPELDGVRLDPSQAWEAARITWDDQAQTAIVEASSAAPVDMPQLCQLR